MSDQESMHGVAVGATAYSTRDGDPANGVDLRFTWCSCLLQLCAVAQGVESDVRSTPRSRFKIAESSIAVAELAVTF